jgi:hypothetical protein
VSEYSVGVQTEYSVGNRRGMSRVDHLSIFFRNTRHVLQLYQGLPCIPGDDVCGGDSSRRTVNCLPQFNCDMMYSSLLLILVAQHDYLCRQLIVITKVVLMFIATVFLEQEPHRMFPCWTDQPVLRNFFVQYVILHHPPVVLMSPQKKWSFRSSALGSKAVRPGNSVSVFVQNLLKFTGRCWPTYSSKPARSNFLSLLTSTRTFTRPCSQKKGERALFHNFFVCLGGPMVEMS